MKQLIQALSAMVKFKWDSDSFLNYLYQLPSDKRSLYQDLQTQLMIMHACHSIDGSVDFHKKRLGKQKFCWQGSKFRYWIWEGKNWRAFASNHQGTSLEIRVGLSLDEALEAFQDYRRKVGLPR